MFEPIDSTLTYQRKSTKNRAKSVSQRVRRKHLVAIMPLQVASAPTCCANCRYFERTNYLCLSFLGRIFINASIFDFKFLNCDPGRRRVCVVLAGGGGGGGDRTTYLYNGINYSSSGRLHPPAPPKLYSNINFNEEKPF